LPSGVRNTFLYEGDSRRVKKEDSTGTVKEVWDEQNILLETNQDDVTQVVYTLEPLLYGNLISQRRNAAARHFHFDGIGSTDRLTDGSAVVTDSAVYEAFGAARAITGATVCVYRFVGRFGSYRDVDLTSVWMRRRTYSPELGRLLSPDTIVDLRAAWPYAYVDNRPTRFIDPSGEVKCDGVKCCCCVEDLKIDQGPYEVPQQRRYPQDPQGRFVFGHVFRATPRLSLVVHDKESYCTLEWYEKSDKVPTGKEGEPEYPKDCKPHYWCQLYCRVNSAVFQGWDRAKKELGNICPQEIGAPKAAGGPGTSMVDWLVIGRGVGSRYLCINIVVKSSCPRGMCKKEEAELWVFQHLEADSQRQIKVQHISTVREKQCGQPLERVRGL
jgi:RHS repeat-associated protein